MAAGKYLSLTHKVAVQLNFVHKDNRMMGWGCVDCTLDDGWHTACGKGIGSSIVE
jgi:hypothetical protein